jgi:hypothetical protein
MPPGILPRLTVALLLGVCGIAAAAEPGKTAKRYNIDWPGHGVRATLEYGTLQGEQAKPVCGGKISLENYGSRHYSVLFFNVTLYSDSKELIATDRFSLSSNLQPGNKADIPFDPRNPLNPVVLTESYSECPKDMRWARVILDAF